MSGILRGVPPRGWPSGWAFEYLILRAFQIEGADVTWPYPVRFPPGANPVEQIDGAVYTGGLSCLIEAKDKGKPVDFEPISTLRTHLQRRPPGVMGVVFSRAGFTEPARILARLSSPVIILLWEGPEFDYSLREQGMCNGLLLKYRMAVERAVPDYNLLERGTR